jgi:hypothetical protein
VAAGRNQHGATTADTGTVVTVIAASVMNMVALKAAKMFIAAGIQAGMIRANRAEIIIMAGAMGIIIPGMAEVLRETMTGMIGMTRTWARGGTTVPGIMMTTEMVTAVFSAARESALKEPGKGSGIRGTNGVKVMKMMKGMMGVRTRTKTPMVQEGTSLSVPVKGSVTNGTTGDIVMRTGIPGQGMMIGGIPIISPVTTTTIMAKTRNARVGGSIRARVIRQRAGCTARQDVQAANR